MRSFPMLLVPTTSILTMITFMRVLYLQSCVIYYRFTKLEQVQATLNETARLKDSKAPWLV